IWRRHFHQNIQTRQFALLAFPLAHSHRLQLLSSLLTFNSFNLQQQRNLETINEKLSIKIAFSQRTLSRLFTQTNITPRIILCPHSIPINISIWPLSLWIETIQRDSGS